MNNILELAAEVLDGKGDTQEIKELAIYCIVKNLTANQMVILRGIAAASPCKCPDGKDGIVMFELVRLGLIHETTLLGKTRYFAATCNALDVINYKI